MADLRCVQAPNGTCGLLSGCDGGTKPVALCASHGLSDSVLDISAGRILRDHFVQVNGVTPQAAPEPAAGSGTHICTKYAGASAQYPVVWCAFDGDHTPNPHDSGQSTRWTRRRRGPSSASSSASPGPRPEPSRLSQRRDDLRRGAAEAGGQE